MALSRWSHSDWYIYNTSPDTVQVSLFGHFTSKDILDNYNQIEQRAVDEGYGFLSRLELRAYLTVWARAKNAYIPNKQASNIIKLLRFYGAVTSYCQYLDKHNMDAINGHMRSFKEYLIERISPRYYKLMELRRKRESKAFLNKIKERRKHDIRN